MDVRTALTSIAWRATVSTLAGLLVSGFAAAALALVTVGSADRLAVGRTIPESLAPVLLAVVGAGFFASIVVFGSFVANDLVRSAGRWLVARRAWFLGLLRAITWSVVQIALAVVVTLRSVARSALVVEAIWLVRTIGRAVLFVLACATVAGLFAIPCIGLIAIGVGSIGESTRLVVAILEDPPRPLAMALRIGGATAVMYIGVAAFALDAWLAYRATRAAVRLASGGKPATIAS